MSVFNGWAQRVCRVAPMLRRSPLAARWVGTQQWGSKTTRHWSPSTLHRAFAQSSKLHAIPTQNEPPPAAENDATDDSLPGTPLQQESRGAAWRRRMVYAMVTVGVVLGFGYFSVPGPPRTKPEREHAEIPREAPQWVATTLDRAYFSERIWQRIGQYQPQQDDSAQQGEAAGQTQK